MGSSYRSHLNGGYMPEWEKKLREAICLVRFVIDEIYDCDEDQIDNATDNGVLIGRLQMACDLISSELPEK